MRRDMDLIRHILLAIEGSNADDPASMHFDSRYSGAQVARHMRLLNDVGYVHALDSTHSSTAQPPYTLTWRGHDYLDLIRDDAVWARIKQAAEKTGGFNSTLVEEIALQEARALNSRRSAAA